MEFKFIYTELLYSAICKLLSSESLNGLLYYVVIVIAVYSDNEFWLIVLNAFYPELIFDVAIGV